MEINFTPEQENFVRISVECGRFPSHAAAVSTALSQWVERERVRMHLIASLEKAQASLDRGEGKEITADSMKQLVADVSRKGRKRLLAK